MHDFHHGYIKHNYGDKAMLLFAGTDSLVHKIKRDDREHVAIVKFVGLRSKINLFVKDCGLCDQGKLKQKER